MDNQLRTVFDRFTQLRNICASQIQDLGNAGGFSGARLWRIDFDDHAVCIRRWPGNMQPSRLSQIHQLLNHVSPNVPVPVPLKTFDGNTYLTMEDHIWQVEPWMPGKADYETTPSNRKLKSALRALASFHDASEAFDSREGWHFPAIQIRISETQNLLDGNLAKLSGAIAADTLAANGLTLDITNELIGLARRYCDLAHSVAPVMLAGLQLSANRVGKNIFCLRDIWHDHLLFTGDQVSGIVDFGAVNFDTPLTDIARLVGSLVGDEIDKRTMAFEAYREKREFSHQDEELVELLDHAGILIAGKNWLDWIWLKQLRFENFELVVRRLRGIITRLETITAGYAGKIIGSS